MEMTITRDRIDLPPGSEVVLRHQSWADYEALLVSRQDKAAIKIYFDASTQEIRIMVPDAGQAKRSDSLADLVKMLLRHQGKDWHSFDTIILKQYKQSGVQPDACFYVQNFKAVLGKEKIDFAVDPPPDLAIEVDQTASMKVEDYRAIAVPELWIYRRKALHIHLFDGQQYQESQYSPTFPNIPVKQLIPEYVECVWLEGSSVALRKFETYLRGLVL